MLFKLLLFYFHASLFSPIYSFKPINNVKFNLKMNMLSDRATLVSKIQQSIPKGSVIVVKYGGHAMEDFALAKFFCEDIAALSEIGLRPVIVHGGGPQIAKTLKSLDITSTFVNGLRVTDPKTMEVAQMVLCGTINKNIVSMISSQPGVKGALGLSGLDSKLIVAKIKEPELGLVGEPVGVNTELIKELLNIGLVPVIAPIGSNELDGGSLNINADTAAGAVAEALKVKSN
jgi:acetylglutamate kinase